MVLRHSKCGKEWETTPTNFLTRHIRCKTCSVKENGERQRLTHEEFLKTVPKSFMDEYTIDGKYTKATNKIPVTHKKCGIQTYKLPKNIRENVGCNICKQSKGERLIQRVLEDNSIIYETDKKFKGLVGSNNYPLSYDFYLPKYNVLIEYQGIQHYESIPHFGGRNRFKKQILNDNTKREFALARGMKLVEIPYYIKEETDIKQMLSKELSYRNVENP